MIGWTLQRLGLRRSEFWWRFRVVMTLWYWWYVVTCPLIGHDWFADDEATFCLRCWKSKGRKTMNAPAGKVYRRDIGFSTAPLVGSRIFFGGEKMRIDEMRELVAAEVPNLRASQTNMPEGPHNRKVAGHRAAVNAARALRDTGALEKEIAQLLSNEEFVDATDPIVVAATTADRFISALNDLRVTAESVLRALSALTLDTSDTQVVLKLPKSPDLSGLVEDLGAINQLLSQAVLNEHVKGEIRVAGFDRGSEWLVLELGSYKAVALLFMMYKFLFWKRNKELDLDIKRENLRTLKLDNDTREKVHAAITLELAEQENTALDAVLKAGEIPATAHELRERIKHSLSNLDRLMKKGLEIGPVTTTPDEIREMLRDYKAFPPLQKQLQEGPAQVDEKEKTEDE